MGWKELPQWLRWGIWLVVIDIIACAVLYLIYPLRGHFNSWSVINPPTSLELAFVRIYDIVLAVFAGPSVLVAFGAEGFSAFAFYSMAIITNIIVYFLIGAVVGLIYKKRNTN